MCLSKRPTRLFFRVIFMLAIVSYLLSYSFFYGFAANRSNLGSAAQALQAFHRRRNDVLRVVGAQALGTDVLDAGSLNDSTDSAAGDNAGTGGQPASAERGPRRTRR